MGFINKVKQNLINLPGWRTSRKIIVFESDDWGSIRMPSKQAYNYFLKKGYPVNHCAYSKNDALESNTDVAFLAEVLSEVKDAHNNPAIFTLNMISGNPDFVSIKKDNFNQYHWEPFYETLDKYPHHNKVLDYYRQGIEDKVFQPQYHGREHINVSRWMDALKTKEKRLHVEFAHQTLTIPLVKNTTGRRDYLDAFGLKINDKDESYDGILKEGNNAFQAVWHFAPETFIAPCYTWHPDLEKTLKKIGVNALQGTHVQRIPDQTKNGKVKRKYHYMGQKNSKAQRYLIRNAFFEPTEHRNTQVVENSLKNIKLAFSYQKPAIIQSHRLNYIGQIHQENRETNLKLLQNLLNAITKTYPDVEFMSSDQLLKLMMS